MDAISETDRTTNRRCEVQQVVDRKGQESL